MKISKKFDPLIAGIAASVIIGILSFLSFETSTGFWLMFSFGSTTLIVWIFYESEFAQPSNIFFGHLLTAIVGLFFLLGQKTPFKIVNWINREIVEFIRSTPLLIQLFFVYFVLPQFGITLSAWVCGMITIGLHFGTYLSEVYRGALEGVPKSQWEACRALNFSTIYTYRRIVLPQAFPL